MQRQRVAVQRGEQRHLELEVGHVELHLGEVDRLRLAQAVLDQVVPRLLAERLVLPKRGPADADIGPGDDDAVGMAAQLSAGGGKAELPAIGAAIAQIEAGLAQPADGQRLELVPGIEDAQDAAVEVPAGILRRVGHLVDQLAGAGLADAAAAEIVARALPLVARDQRGIDMRVDERGGVGHAVRGAP